MEFKYCPIIFLNILFGLYYVVLLQLQYLGYAVYLPLKCNLCCIYDTSLSHLC